MSIVLVGSTSGSVTLQEPAVAGSTVLTLPAVSGTVLTTGSSGQSIPKAALPTGSVLQVVQGSTTTGTTLAAGTSFTASNLTASITPTSSSSKVLILINGQMYGSTTSAEPQGTIYRNNTTNLISGSSQMTDTYSGAGAVVSNAVCVYLDSPATTSSTTYTFYFKNSVAGNGTFPVNGGTATIVLMEISA
jgi:hypothetical protein